MPERKQVTWLVTCQNHSCHWSNYRAGTRADVVKNTCPRDGGELTATRTYFGIANTSSHRMPSMPG